MAGKHDVIGLTGQGQGQGQGFQPYSDSATRKRRKAVIQLGP